jgi:tetratricopeptide (TPR) repeat protein
MNANKRKWGARLYLRSFAFICGLSFSVLSAAPAEWLRLRSPHFEMLTTAGEKKGREAILYFEAVRAFFETSRTVSESAHLAPVRIIAFHSEKEFEPYRYNQFSSAYYLAGTESDTIVMESITPERYPAAIHEYTHLVIHRSGLRLPIWLNEGLADLYSSLRPQGKKILVGELIPGRLHRLLSSKPIPLEQLAAVDRESPWYNERDRASVFYAESWALTHMLALSEEYRPKFSEFVSAIDRTGDFAGALERAYHKTVRQVEDDLRRYFSGRLVGSLVDAKLDKGAEEPSVERLPELDSQIALAEVLSSTKRTSQAGRAMYERLRGQNPDRPEIEGGLARLEMRERNTDAARQHFARAVELGSKDPRVFLDYGMCLRGRTSDARAMEMFRKALAIDPELDEAHYHLGFVLMRANQNREALAEFAKVRHPRSEQAFAYFRAVGIVSVRLGLMDAARAAAERAKSYAGTSVEKDELEQLMKSIRSAGPR